MTSLLLLVAQPVLRLLAKEALEGRRNKMPTLRLRRWVGVENELTTQAEIKGFKAVVICCR